MLHAILVTTDFSDASRRSLAAAAALARRFRARLELVHVEEDGQGEERLANFARRDAAIVGVEVETKLLHGESPDVLRRFQESEGIDLLVIASHGYRDVKSFLTGSFATKAIQDATCPILIFREVDGQQSPGQDGRRPSPLDFAPRRILVPHDFSATSSAALETARSWARAFRASVRILFVAPLLPDGRKADPARSLAGLRDIVARDWEGIPAEPVISKGNPAEEILREAEALHADLILLASHGHSGPGGRPLGSVAERVIHAARCPVLVVKSRRP